MEVSTPGPARPEMGALCCKEDGKWSGTEKKEPTRDLARMDFWTLFFFQYTDKVWKRARAEKGRKKRRRRMVGIMEKRKW